MANPLKTILPKNFSGASRRKFPPKKPLLRVNRGLGLRHAWILAYRPKKSKKGIYGSASIKDIKELISQLDAERAWLLEQIDRGRWPELRFDLAALEREMGQLLAKASERLEEDSSFR